MGFPQAPLLRSVPAQRTPVSVKIPIKLISSTRQILHLLAASQVAQSVSPSKISTCSWPVGQPCCTLSHTRPAEHAWAPSTRQSQGDHLHPCAMQHRRRAGIGPAPQLHPWTVSVAQLHEAPRYGQRIRVDLALAAAVPVFLHRSSSQTEYRDHSLVEAAFEVACSSDRRACSLGVMERGPLPTPWVGKRRGTPGRIGHTRQSTMYCKFQVFVTCELQWTRRR